MNRGIVRVVKRFESIGKKKVVDREGAGEKVKNIVGNASVITQEKMLETLDQAYSKTVTGLPGQKTIDVLVNDYLSKYDKETAMINQ